MLPSSLETLQLGPDDRIFSPDDPNAPDSNKFEGGIPAEWAGLTNLKKINVAKCGLDGKPLSTLVLPLWCDITISSLLQPPPPLPTGARAGSRRRGRARARDYRTA